MLSLLLVSSLSSVCSPLCFFQPCPAPQYYPISFPSPSFLQPFLSCQFLFPALPSPSFRQLPASARPLPFLLPSLSPPSASFLTGPIQPSPPVLVFFTCPLSSISPYSFSICDPYNTLSTSPSASLCICPKTAGCTGLGVQMLDWVLESVFTVESNRANESLIVTFV